MTTCAECLSVMSTSRLSELESSSAVALHCATCADCARVAEEVRYAEYRLATALNDQRSALNPSDLTVVAKQGSERLRRKRIARWLQIALVIAGCYVFYVFMEQRTNPPPNMRDGAGIVTRTIPLRCITPAQATALATPYLRSRAGIYPVPGISAITVRAKEEELQRALSAIDQFDAQCQLPSASTEPPTTSPAKPGKD